MRLNLVDPHHLIGDLYLTDYDLVSDARFDIIDYDQWCSCPPRPDPERTFFRLQKEPVLVSKDDLPTSPSMDIDTMHTPSPELCARDELDPSNITTYRRVLLDALPSPPPSRTGTSTNTRKHRRVILNPARESVPELRDWPSFLRVMLDVTQGLNAMRMNGWLHGDVGPHTCLWDAKGQIGSLSDWDYTTWCYGEPRGVGPKGPEYC